MIHVQNTHQIHVSGDLKSLAPSLGKATTSVSFAGLLAKLDILLFFESWRLNQPTMMTIYCFVLYHHMSAPDPGLAYDTRLHILFLLLLPGLTHRLNCRKNCATGKSRDLCKTGIWPGHRRCVGSGTWPWEESCCRKEVTHNYRRGRDQALTWWRTYQYKLITPTMRVQSPRAPTNINRSHNVKKNTRRRQFGGGAGWG